MTLAPLGDSAVVVTLGPSIDESTLMRVRSFAAALELEKSAAIIDVVPAYATVTVFYEIAPAGVNTEPPYQRICRVISKCLAKIEHCWPDLIRENLEKEHSREAGRLVEIPVCYGGQFGPDIAEVARRCALSSAEVTALHSDGIYDVHAVGFAPGFPYLGGLPEKLHTPRKATPRLSVPAGSVGIGGPQTGVYPVSSPGGWQLIGRTPRTLFDLRNEPPALVRVGDRVKFRPISEEEFATWS
jgi:inhibitor of KinA